MFEEVEASGLGRAFEWFFLSDTTDPEIFVGEEQVFPCDAGKAWPRLPPVLPAPADGTSIESPAISRISSPVRAGRYEHMVVLDADSLMAGRTIIALAAAMEADPDAGIIQTLPLIVNRNTYSLASSNSRRASMGR